MNDDSIEEVVNDIDKAVSEIERAVQILEEALSGTSPKSKNSLIQEAIKVLK